VSAIGGEEGGESEKSMQAQGDLDVLDERRWLTLRVHLNDGESGPTELVGAMDLADK